MKNSEACHWLFEAKKAIASDLRYNEDHVNAVMKKAEEEGKPLPECIYEKEKITEVKNMITAIEIGAEALVKRS